MFKKNNLLLNFIFLITILLFLIGCDFIPISEDDFLNKKNKSNSQTALFIEENAVKSSLLGEGAYEIDSPTDSICKKSGDFFLNGTDFTYGDQINFLDTKNDGPFESDKYLRILNNLNNISTDLNLTPIAMDLQSKITPPIDHIYIDPEKGLFIMPRPNYWSKCDNIGELTEAEIYDNNNKPILPTTISFYSTSGGKFNNALYITPPSEAVRYFSPFGGKSDFDKITFSAYVRLMDDPDAQSRFSVFFDMQDIPTWTYVCFQNRRTNGENYISVNGNTTAPHDDGLDDGMHHIYIVADKNAGLNNGNSIVVYINGQKVLSTTQTFNFNTLTLWFQNIQNEGWVIIDNIKIWDHIVSEDPSWIYNEGNGRKDALHEIYGPDNDYTPGQVQVGYYYND